jgi:hypothetical protein
MANTVTKTTVTDSKRLAVVHVYLQSDGSSGELTDEVVIDVSALARGPEGNLCDHVRVRRVYGSMDGFTAFLEFDATTDDRFLNFPNGAPGVYADFTAYGGVEDPESSGTTGDVILTTAGFTAATDAGWFVIEAEKIYA